MAATGMGPSNNIDEQALHQRLLAGDPTASSDVFKVFYEDLAGWLKRKSPSLVPGIDEGIYRDAAFKALDDYIKAPHKYDPSRRGLKGYLKMAADGDLKNLLQREQYRRSRSSPIEDIVVPPPDRNELVEEGDEEIRQRLLVDLSKGLSEAERNALPLVLDGERSTDELARALGIDHLPQEEREREVKRFKDKIKKRAQRRGAEYYGL